MKKVNEFREKLNFLRILSLVMEMMMMTRRRKIRKRTRKMEERKIRKRRKILLTRSNKYQLKR